MSFVPNESQQLSLFDKLAFLSKRKQQMLERSWAQAFSKGKFTLSTESDIITDDQAIAAIRNYCHINNPDLADIEKAGEYPVYWEIASSNDKEIVVLYRSYTGAQIRYYINPVSGDTYVTEFVSGITEDEERTDESLNVKDYISENDPSAENVSSIPGTWATASMGMNITEMFFLNTMYSSRILKSSMAICWMGNS